MTRSILTVASLYWLLTTVGLADVLHLANGDRLTGTWQGTENGQVVFISELLGPVRVAEAQVLRVERSEAVVAEAPATAPAVAPAAAAAAPVAAAPAAPDTEEKASVLLRALDFLNPLKDWDSRLSAGYTWLGGQTSRHNFFLMYEATRKRELSEWQARGRWDYGSTRIDKQTAIKIEDRYRFSLQYRRNLLKQVFVQSLTQYNRDHIKLIDHDFEQSIGIGWRMFDTQRLRVTFTPSYTARYRQIALASSGWQSLFSLFQDLRYEITPRVIFTEEAAISFEPDETSKSDYRFHLKLENKLTDRLSVDLRYEYAFEYRVGLGIERKDQKFIAAMGYRI
jgi:opacity protein-like surface antigen